MPVKVQTEDFDMSREIAELRASDARVGAVVSFLGCVRDLNLGTGVSTLTLEHYAGMTELALEDICQQAAQRFDVYDSLVIHRFGLMRPLEQIVMVAVTSAHRGEAFKACEFIMDYLKTQAPFWKKEETPQGSRWVESREADEVAAARWKG
jgi:molybdopterin synthase catalytic subunit